MQKQKKRAGRSGVAHVEMTEAEREAASRMYDETLRDFVEGSIVQGKVLEVRSSEILMDIGYKSEGVISAQEFGDMTAVKPGDVFSVLLEGAEDDDGMVVLSKRKAEQKQKWDNVLESFKEGGTTMGRVTARVKGGLIVDVAGVEAFLPGSQIDISPVHDPDGFVGNMYEFKILKINPERHNIVLSRRELLEERRRDKKRELLSELKVGQIRKGTIKNITDFGVFVDLDGLDGLLHITDMSWGRINHPSEMVASGQPIEVVILDINTEKERVSLGLKQRTPNPWDNIESKFPVGSRLRGKVVNLVPYGAFVELEQGVEGLVHVSEISWTKRIARASDVLTVGQEVDVVVLTINKADQKIALGMRQTEENPWDGVRERYPIGARVHGKVRNFTSYGAFVELEEGIDGMIHVSDMSWTRKINHPSEVLKKGDDVDAVVLEVSPENQRISLGLKQAQEDPWSSIAARYKVGQLVQGKVTKLASFGAFIDMGEGVDGLVHISQISDDRVEKVRDVLKVGQDVSARVVRIDPVERKIGLSIKAANVADEDFVVKDEMLEGLRPGEDLVDLAGAFDAAFGASDQKEEDWHPGARKSKDKDKE
jgi:small subunit ribosomal protein S1